MRRRPPISLRVLGRAIAAFSFVAVTAG